MIMNKYICWGDDKEDLSKKVKQAVEVEIFLPEFRVSVDASSSATGKQSRKKNKRRISVTCEKGHINMFDVE
jgi:hypothetical protein